MEIIRRTTGPYQLNTYILICRKTKDAVLIDPGGPAEELLSILKKRNVYPRQILNTHGHADQFFSTGKFKEVFDCPSSIHRDDNEFFKKPEIQEATFKAVKLPPPYPADRELNHGDRIHFGVLNLTVIHTPGHTPGSVCFYGQGHLFAGDTLFIGEAGRTDLPGGDLETLIHSIKTRILPLDKSTVLHPGHHHGDLYESTLEQEIKDNIYITDFILDP